MYRNFFSLSDLPFSIAPDPKYIFMSDRHKEALSHLTYGLGEVGGFALLTGEVGTGKTTISRCLMEQLPDDTQAAFILNPMLSSQELLATLCDKLEIQYHQDEITLKNLTDKISEKLLENHENGINTLLIIDEAQHLQPEVLEQLRLLTNLETNTKKLLQVILIGQPELQQLLQRRDLRQLAQRITARYHLMPLTKAELKQYIEHRLAIADCTRKLFDKGAITRIHQLSQGVPRLTNLLCHSALMTAYNQNDSVVNKKIVNIAAEVALGPTELAMSSHQNGSKKILVAATVFSALAFMTLAAFWWGQNSSVIHEPLASDNNTAAKVAEKNIQDLESSEIDKNTEQLIIDHKVPEAKGYDVSNDKVFSQGANNYALHTVKYGDTLFGISIAYNTKLSSIKLWNNITEGDDISIGDKLHVQMPHSFTASTVNVGEDSKVGSSKQAKSESMRVISGDKPTKQSPVKIDNQSQDYSLEQVDGVSDDLLARFQAAIEDTAGENSIETEAVSASSSQVVEGNGKGTAEVKPLSQLPSSIQNALPAMQFEQHIYSSDGDGWVTVNGRDRYQGDYINNDLRVEEILPQQVILSFRGERFSMPALTNW